MASKSGVRVVMQQDGSGLIQREKAPRITVGTMARTFNGAGTWTGWKLESTGGKWWATCPGSFNDAAAIAHQHFGGVVLNGKH